MGVINSASLPFEITAMYHQGGCLSSTAIQSDVGSHELRRILWCEALRGVPLLQANTGSNSPLYKVMIKNNTQDLLEEGATRIFTDESKTNVGLGCEIYSTIPESKH